MLLVDYSFVEVQALEPGYTRDPRVYDVKVVKVLDAEGGRTPIVRELGKTWYVRLPDEQCAAAAMFARERAAFWTLLRETRDQVLTGDAAFVERQPAGQPPRFARMYEVEEEFARRDLADPAVRAAARERILRVIDEYRVR